MLTALREHAAPAKHATQTRRHGHAKNRRGQRISLPFAAHIVACLSLTIFSHPKPVVPTS